MLADVPLKLFTLQKLKGVGPSTLAKLAEMPAFAAASIKDLGGVNAKLARALEPWNAWEDAVRAAEADMESATKVGARIVCVLDDEYPKLLKKTRDRPFFLFVQGKLERRPSRAVAVIGTRYPTEHGRLVAERITDFLVADEWSIISGLALGCDAIAHEVALAREGHTVAVLAHGLHTVAPREHKRLANQILDEGGALVTEYGFGIEPFPHQFVRRDRIQAGLAQGVVMIQSDLSGGSLHASRAAIDYQRVLAVPVATERDASNQERKISANVLLCSDNDREKARLLNCSKEDLSHIFCIRRKEDYSILSQILFDDNLTNIWVDEV